MKGKVYIVGAGCGSADLISMRALNVLKTAETVVYDRLLGDGVFRLIPEQAEKINAGKASGNHLIPQDEINRILSDKAMEGKTVVRLKGGDPFLFGRGGEEAEFLADHHIPFEIIPGISSSIAVPELAGIPVTHRGLSSAVHILTGHFKDDQRIDYSALVKAGGTYVFLMGLRHTADIQDGFLQAGLDPRMPCAVIENGGTALERVGLTELSQLAKTAEHFVSPGMIVIGRVCTLHQKLYVKKPLFGRRIVIARPFERGESLKKRLESGGAEVHIVPDIRLIPFEIGAEQLCDRIKAHDYIVFTSRTGVRLVMDQMFAAGYDARIFGGKQIAVTGSGTAAELTKYGLHADLIPDEFYTDQLATLLVSRNADRILLLRAENGLKEMDDILSQHHISFQTLYIYKTEKAQEQNLPDHFDTVVFASPSEAAYFETDRRDFKAVCIGRRTLEVAQKRGLDCVLAKTQTDDGLFQAVCDCGNDICG